MREIISFILSQNSLFMYSLYIGHVTDCFCVQLERVDFSMPFRLNDLIINSWVVLTKLL